MAAESKPTKRGCLPKFVSLLLFLSAVGLAVALYFASQPQDMTDVKGYHIAAPGGRDLGQVLASAAKEGYDLKLPEEEINGWLRRTLEIKQGGFLADRVKLEGVAVRLEKDRAEVILERSVFGRPFTTSMYVRIEKTEDSGGVLTQVHLDGGAYSDDFPKLKKGGRIGKLVVPQGFLILMRPGFEKIGAQLSTEIDDGIKRMNRVVMTEGFLELDPRDAAERSYTLPGTF